MVGQGIVRLVCVSQGEGHKRRRRGGSFYFGWQVEKEGLLGESKVG